MTTTATRPRPHNHPTDLLSAYLPASFFWSSARGSLLAEASGRSWTAGRIVGYWKRGVADFDDED